MIIIIIIIKRFGFFPSEYRY